MQIQSNSEKNDKNFKLPAIYQKEAIDDIFFSRYTMYKQSWRTVQDLHYHNYPECGICLKGDGLFFVEDRIYPFTSGTVIYFPAGVHHIAQSPVERNSLWEYIWLDEKALGVTLPAHEVIVQDGDCRALFRMMQQEITSKGDRELYIHLCASFFGKMNKYSLKETGIDEETRKSILPAIQWIAVQYNEPVTTQRLAKICSLSESTLRRNFLKVTGQTPMNFANSVRLIMAEQLLHDTALSVLEISERCGFPCLSTFNRQFLKRNGISPREFRKRE